MKQNTPNQRGSAIIWILIAIGLFAALSVAFTSTSRQSTSLLTNEQASAYANQIISYGNDIKQAVKRLQLRGCEYDKISFEDFQTGYSPNPNAPSDKSCHIYDNNGAGLLYKPLPHAALTSAQDNNMQGWAAKIDSVGDNAHSEILWSAWNIKPEVCLKINDNLGIQNTGGILPQDTMVSSQWDTNWADGINDSLVIALGDEAAEISGKKAFCYQNPSISNVSEYIVVMIAR